MNLKFLTKSILLCLLASLGSILHAQTGANPGNKYAEAYKEYMNAPSPIADDSIRHYVYFARDREALIDHPFLSHPAFEGAQIMYCWRVIEPKEGQYDFSAIAQDYDYLKKYGKKLFIQLQDATFSPRYKAVPDYLLTDFYDGGETQQCDDTGRQEGWVAKRWNKNVRERFALLLQALGKEFDGKIEGINLQETAIGINSKTHPGFSEQAYVAGLKENMLALKKAFPQSTTMIYANFVSGEWLPGDDKGYLRSIYLYGEQIGVGLGAPDLMVTRKGQLNHALTLMHEGHYSVPVGIAVQDGNYIGKTGADADADPNSAGRKNIVPLLHAFAKDFLRVDYMFWANQTPYFEQDVLPCFTKD